MQKTPDLVLTEREPDTTLTHWLYSELRRAILEGRLPRRAPLPPTRMLAQTYKLSRRIVVNVFDQLRDEGYLTARVGAGTTVSDSIPEDFLPSPRKRTPQQPPSPRIETGDFYRRPVRPFRPIEPALSEFPIAIWARLTARATRGASTALLAGGDAAGYRPLREAIAAHLGSTRGVACSPDHIVITSGTQQSLDLLSRTVLRPGDAVWIEDPAYTDAADAFRSTGARVVPIPVDEHGMRVHPAQTKKQLPKAVYLTPAHQFPLGASLRLDRRLDLLQWTRRHGIAIFEDDYDSEFRFSGKPVPAMKGLSGAGHVFLLGTFNKSMFPALRLGYIIAPDAWLDAVLRVRRLMDRYPAALPQSALAAFLAEGHYTKHLRRMRELYGTRLESLRTEVNRHLAGVLALPEIQAGLNTPAFLLNENLSSGRAVALAQQHNVEAWPLDRFAIARKDLRGLVLGFAAFNEREIRSGVTALARALVS
ncbi:MAG TPA: PLP-dependent aminotransferase family protein [Bryobacteraceae bacterium]|jgi:GntR family transcriptional regulator/MocR family aminotransferase